MKPRTCTSSTVPAGTPWLGALAPEREDIPVVQQCLLRYGQQNGWIEDGLALVGDVKVVTGVWYCAVFPEGEAPRAHCLAELLNMGYAVEVGYTLHP